MKKLLITCMIVSLLAIVCIACEEDLTEPEAHSGTVTFNLTAPAFEQVSGNEVFVGLLASWNNSIPFVIEEGTFSGSATTLQIPDVDPGTYVAVAAIDGEGDGFPADEPFGEHDLFWMGLDLVVDGDEVINVSQYAWQEIELPAILVGFRGLPAGHNGDIFASGIFPDETDIFADPGAEPYYGGVGIVYNTSAVLAFHPDGDSAESALPSGSYDLLMLLDVDGNMADWHDTTDGMRHNPISNGDLIASHDFTFDASDDADYGQLITAAAFTEVLAFTLTLNLTVPTGENLEGNSVLGAVWTSFEDEDPFALDATTISSGLATLQIPIMVDVDFSVAVFLDRDGSGYDNPDDGPLDYGDYFWGAMNISMTASMTVSVPANAWQQFHSMIVGVDNIPAGHDGEIFSLAVTPADGNPFNPYREDVAMGGFGLIYNSSAIIMPWPFGDADSTWTLQNGDYKIWCLIDVDGVLDDYLDADDSLGFSPVTDGDYYTVYDYTFPPAQGDDILIQISSSFSPVVGISGTVSCPDWNSGGGGTYVYLFEENPLVSDTADAYSFASLTQPGAYWLPCLPGDSVYAVGFWDTDDSGEWDGPSQDDLIGGYGSSIDSLEAVLCTPLGVGNIDFVLDTPYDTTLFEGPGR